MTKNEKISKALMGNKNGNDHVMSIESRLKAVETRQKNGTYKHSDESKLKMSKTRKGMLPWNKGLTKDDYSDIYLNNLSIGQKKRYKEGRGSVGGSKSATQFLNKLELLFDVKIEREV